MELEIETVSEGGSEWKKGSGGEGVEEREWWRGSGRKGVDV